MVAHFALFFSCILASLKSLHALLRSDDNDTQPRHLSLGHWRIFASHLLPLLSSSIDNPLYIKHIIRLMCVMTMEIPNTCTNATLRMQHAQGYIS